MRNARRPHGAMIVWASVMLAAACSGEEPSPPGALTTRRGDTIVVSVAAPIHAERGQLVTDWQIGGADAPQENAFSFVADIAVGRDGSVYISEFGGNVPPVRRYDASGQYAGTVGRRGQGPGEYMFLATGVKGLRDGRIALRDLHRRLVHFYSASGESDTTWHFPTVVTGASGSFTLLTDTAGFIYVRDGHDSRPSRPAFDGLIRFGAKGVVVDSIPMPALDFVADSVTIPGRGEILPWALPVPFSPRPFVQWSPLGYFVTAVSTRYSIDLRLPPDGSGVSSIPAVDGAMARPAPHWMQGHEILSIRRDVEPVPVTAEERDEQASIIQATGQQRDRRWSWDNSVIPAAKPPFRGIHVGDDGRIWVLLSMPAIRVEPVAGAVARGEFRDAPAIPIAQWVEAAVYDIFESDGRYVGQVETPRDFRVHVTRGDTLWGSARDADDVPIVKRLHIVWPR